MCVAESERVCRGESKCSSRLEINGFADQTKAPLGCGLDSSTPEGTWLQAHAADPRCPQFHHRDPSGGCGCDVKLLIASMMSEQRAGLEFMGPPIAPY